MQGKNMERDVIPMIKKLISLILIITVTACSMITAFAFDVSLTDIDSSHWAYAAIAELVGKKTVNGYPDGSFKPNGIVTYAEFEKMITGEWKNNPTPINREAALDMLWSYSGTPTNYSAPGIITKQMANKDAVAWGYATGLMQGNDGLNLRPLDTLTRAEAATLIVRSTKPSTEDNSFAASVSEDILKLVWDKYNIFEGEYIPTDVITPEQLWAATKKFGDITRDEIDVKTATVEDAALLLSYASGIQAHASVSLKGNADTASDKYGTFAQIYTAYAFEQGLQLPADKAADVTKKDAALILVQLDDLVGKDGYKLNKNIAQYPANYEDYAYLTEGVPFAVYATPFELDAKPVDIYDFASNFSSIFENFVNNMAFKYGKDNAEFTFYPTLVCQDSTDVIVRVKCTVKNGTGFDVFGEGFENAGSEFYVDLHAGTPVPDLTIPLNKAFIGKFICNQ